LNTELEGTFGGFIGLNNGNGRGSMDSFWGQNFSTSFPGQEQAG